MGAFIGGSIVALAMALNLIYRGRTTGYGNNYYTILTLNTNAGLDWKVLFFEGAIFMWYFLYHS